MTTPAPDAPPPPSRPNEPKPQRSHETQALLWELAGAGLVLLIGILIVGLLHFAINLRKSSIEEERKAAEALRVEKRTSVVTMPLTPVRVTDRILLPGMVQAWVDTPVSAEVGGQVLKTPVQDGARVKKGDILLQLDERDYRIALQRAKANLTLTKANFQRTEALAKDRVSSTAELDQARSAYESAQAELDAAKLALERCVIRAPIGGLVNDILPEEGQYISSGDRIAQILDIDKVKIEVYIPEKDVSAIRNLKECSLQVDAVETGWTTKGKCIYLSYSPSQGALVYTLRLQVENKQHLLRPGMIADVKVIRGIHENSLLVPLFAVIARGEGQQDGHIVYVMEKASATQASADPVKKNGNTEATASTAEANVDYIARERKVTIGLIQGDQVQILSGLEPGEELIVMGQRSVVDNAPVRLIKRVATVAEINQ